MFKSLFLPLIGVAAFVTIVGLMYQGKLPLTQIKTEQSKPRDKYVTINNNKIYVEVAKSDTERSKGLSGRSSLDSNSGMIFVFNNQKPTFWMKDTLIPLDIIWINDGIITGINKNVPIEKGVTDSNLKKYPAPSEIDYVLEVNAGYCDKNSIKVGDSVEFNSI